MPKDYSNKDLKKASLADQDLSYARFNGSDLRGARFTNSNLSGAEFTGVKTGIPPWNIVLIFVFALVVSAVSGYIAMLAGNTVQQMLSSQDKNVWAAGIITIVLTFLFIVYSYWKGTNTAFRNLIIPALIAAALVGFTAYFSGLGTGKGMLYQILALILVVIMFIVGTIARATAGALSNILFTIVALAGGIFGKTVGGGIGTAVMAISCALISKKALSGAKGFEGLQKIAFYITSAFGTSFRNCRMANADFSRSKKIRNADFSNADIVFVHWGDTKKINCVIRDENRIQKT